MQDFHDQLCDQLHCPVRRLKRLSLKKRPGYAHIHKLLPHVSTADTQVPRSTEGPGRHLEGVAQGPNLSTAAVPQRPFHDAESSIRAPEACLRGSAGKADQFDATVQSRSCLAEAAGMSGAFEGAPMPTAGLSRAITSGRPPLQAWVPRKRNLASFDALDELSQLTGHKQLPTGGQGSHLTALSQSGPEQQLSSGLPLRAPTKCLSGAQEPALQRVYIPGRPTIPPADLPKGPEGATGPHACYAQEQGWRTCSRAPGTGLAASTQLARHSGTTVPGHRLHHKPFAPPRLLQKPEAEDDASARPSASTLASAGCGSDGGALLGDSATASPHHTHRRSGKSNATSPVPRGSGSAWVSDGVISDSEASEASESGPDRQQPGNGPAGVAPVNRASILIPLKVASYIAHGSRELQQLVLPCRQDAIGERYAHSHHAQPVSPAKGPSYCSGETASPPGAAAASMAQQLGKRGQSAGRKRLKRLYIGSDDAHMPPRTAGPTKGMEVTDSATFCREQCPLSFLAHMFGLPAFIVQCIIELLVSRHALSDHAPGEEHAMRQNGVGSALCSSVRKGAQHSCALRNDSVHAG